MSVEPLPVWNKRSTPAERLEELARLARLYPERYKRLLVIWQKDTDDGAIETAYVPAGPGIDTNVILGMLDLARVQIYQNVRRYIR